jgi:[acyl-carrier-protein] S-malonyltransferase
MKTGFLFPGQGAQFSGMGKKLFDEFKSVREVFELASDTLKLNMKKLCFESSNSELKLTFNAQPSILTVSFAGLTVLKEILGISPALSAGHSLGEWTALLSAHSISFEDALKCVRKRGEFMQESIPGINPSMAAIIGISSKEVEDVLKDMEGVYPANYNSSTQTVISGKEEAVEEAVEKLKEKKARVVYLNVSAPFHTPFMKPAEEKMREFLKDITFRDPSIPVLKNIDAEVYKSADEIKDSLARQISSPVRWIDCMRKFLQMEPEIIIETGPRPVLINLIEGGKEIKKFSVCEPKDIKILERAIK